MAPKRPKGAGAFPKAVETPAPSPVDPASLYAALDLGTNSCRMLFHIQKSCNNIHLQNSKQ